jgi:hypothetical protein
MSHLPPKTLWSTLKPQERTGSFISLNAYQCSTAHGERLPTPISRVRVTVLKAPMNTVETLGEVPVEQDGSFYLAVPVDQPLRFALLDQSGKTIMEQSSWIWVRPGEEHGCVGCHEDKAVAPSNRWPLTLKRLDTPMRLGVQQ